MPTETDPLATPANRVYLLAHQDDEMACIAQIDRDQRQGNKSHFVYLADNGPDDGVRDAETRRLLGHYGVPDSRIHFLGRANGLPQMILVTALEKAYAFANDFIATLPAIPEIITLDYEGGHADHDAVHLVAAALLANNKTSAVYTVSLYHSGYWPAPFYSCGRPLPSTGPRYRLPVSISKAVTLASAARFYPSQRLTWLGLAPPFLLNLWRYGGMVYHALARQKAWHRPHASRLLYEQRFNMGYDAFMNAAQPFITRHMPESPL